MARSKQGQSRLKQRRGLWGENKEKFSVRLTPTGKRLALQRCEAIGISVSDLLELFGRGMPIPQANEQVVQSPLQVKMQLLFAVVEFLKEGLGEGMITFSALIEAALLSFGGIEELSEASFLSRERLEEIRQGQRPNDNELTPLSGVLRKADGTNYSDAELWELRQEIFGNEQEAHL